jgi:hypothetical protein
MERFDDVSVLASVDESPPPPRMPRHRRRALTAVVATVVATGALAGAAVGLASEKSEPSSNPSTAREAGGWMNYSGTGHHLCHRGDRLRPSSSSSSSSAPRY